MTVLFNAAEYCILSAALRYIEEHPETWADVEAKANKLMGYEEVHPLTAHNLDIVNQVVWQHYDSNPKKE